MDGIGSNEPITFSHWARMVAPPTTVINPRYRAAYELGAKHIFKGRSLDYPSVYESAPHRKAEKEGRQDAQATIEGGVLTVLCDCCMQPFPVFNGRDKAEGE